MGCENWSKPNKMPLEKSLMFYGISLYENHPLCNYLAPQGKCAKILQIARTREFGNCNTVLEHFIFKD